MNKLGNSLILELLSPMLQTVVEETRAGFEENKLKELHAPTWKSVEDQQQWSLTEEFGATNAALQDEDSAVEDEDQGAWGSDDENGATSLVGGLTAAPEEAVAASDEAVDAGDEEYDDEEDEEKPAGPMKIDLRAELNAPTKPKKKPKRIKPDVSKRVPIKLVGGRFFNATTGAFETETGEERQERSKEDRKGRIQTTLKKIFTDDDTGKRSITAFGRQRARMRVDAHVKATRPRGFTPPMYCCVQALLDSSLFVTYCMTVCAWACRKSSVKKSSSTRQLTTTPQRKSSPKPKRCVLVSCSRPRWIKCLHERSSRRMWMR